MCAAGHNLHFVTRRVAGDDKYGGVFAHTRNGHLSRFRAVVPRRCGRILAAFGIADMSHVLRHGVVFLSAGIGIEVRERTFTDRAT